MVSSEDPAGPGAEEQKQSLDVGFGHKLQREKTKKKQAAEHLNSEAAGLILKLSGFPKEEGEFQFSYFKTVGHSKHLHALSASLGFVCFFFLFPHCWSFSKEIKKGKPSAWNHK